MFQAIVILAALLTTMPVYAHQEFVAFLGGLKYLGEQTGQAFQKSGAKIDQSSHQAEKKQPKKKKTANIKTVGEMPHTENKMNDQTKENHEIRDGSKEQTEEDYQILNGRNDNVENNKSFELLR